MNEANAQEIIEGLQSLNVETRVNSAKKLKVLCEILGPEKTTNKLVEFLHDLNEEDPLVQMEMSNHLNFLINFLTNVNECSPVLEFLLTFLINYEKKINTNGYKAFKSYLKKCNSDILISVICPKIFQLAKSESDNYKIGICRVIPSVIKKCIYENQTKHSRIFIHIFLDLCQDACILVKKNSCDQFCKFLKTLKLYNINAINKKNLQNEKARVHDRKEDTISKREEKEKEEEEDKIFRERMWAKSKEIYHSFFYPINGLDEVQTSAIRILSDILETDPNYINDIKIFLTNLCNDDNWRVRAVLANNIHKILKSVQNSPSWNNDKNKSTQNSDLSIIVLLLLKDLDSNVRSTVFDNLDKIFLYSKIQTNIIEEIFEDLKRDIDSNNLHLKISLCKMLCTLPDFLDKNNSIEYILPLFLLFIRIEETELKSDLFVCLHKISKFISFADMKQIMIPLSSEIVKSKNWRMRYSLYYYLKYFDHFFFITNKNGEVTFNNKIFWDLIQTGANDVVYTVRNVTIETTEFLMQDREFRYFEKGLCFLLNDLKESTNYLLRITCLHYISHLIRYFPLNFIKIEILNILNILSKDKINNVRFNVLKTVYHVKNYVQYVFSIIKKNQYNELIKTVTYLLQSTNEKNIKNQDNWRKNEARNYFRKFEKKISLTIPENINNVDQYFLKNPFLINASSLSSLSYYDNMNNNETNEKNCEYIFNFLSNILNSLVNDTDEDVSKASSILQKDLQLDAKCIIKNDEFLYHINSAITFSTLCRPIK